MLSNATVIARKTETVLGGRVCGLDLVQTAEPMAGSGLLLLCVVLHSS